MFEYVERQREAQCRMADMLSTCDPYEDAPQQEMHCPVCAARLVAGDWLYTDDYMHKACLGCCECCEIGDSGALVEKATGTEIAEDNDFEIYVLEG